jgi:hypothetical protein
VTPSSAKKMNEIIFECTFCPRTFYSLEVCNVHINKHSKRGDKGKKCLFCLKFTNNTKMHLQTCEAYQNRPQNQRIAQQKDDVVGQQAESSNY